MSGTAVTRRGLLLRPLRRLGEEAPPAPAPPPVEWGPGALPGPTPEVVQAVLAAVGAPGRVLVPEGEGRLAAALRGGGAQVVLPGARRRLPFADGELDAVASCFGAVHAGPPGDVGRELHRVLRPGGRLALSVWSAFGPHARALRAAATSGSRPSRWGAFDGLVLALDRFGGFEADERDGWTLVTAQR